jgi:hypothetical protein
MIHLDDSRNWAYIWLRKQPNQQRVFGVKSRGNQVQPSKSFVYSRSHRMGLPFLATCAKCPQGSSLETQCQVGHILGLVTLCTKILDPEEKLVFGINRIISTNSLGPVSGGCLLNSNFSMPDKNQPWMQTFQRIALKPTVLSFVHI